MKKKKKDFNCESWMGIALVFFKYKSYDCAIDIWQNILNKSFEVELEGTSSE
jgi:hypothetical protein